MAPTASKSTQPAKKSEKTSGSYDPRIDAIIHKAPEFAQPILEHLRACMHEAVPDVTEDVKWSRPFFVLNGELLGYMAAFKQHCSLGFWSPKMAAMLKEEGMDNTEGSGSIGKIRTLQELPPKKALVGYMRTAAEMIRNGTAGPGPMGERASKARRPALPMPEEFVAALAKSKPATANFDAFPPGCQREYIEWIVTAKRPETRERRIAEAVAKIAEGKRHNEQYRSK